MRLLLTSTLLCSAAAFVLTTPRAHCDAVRCEPVRASADDKQKITMEGWKKIRERQRLRTQGASISEWGKTANLPDGAVDLEKMPAHMPVPPTKEQSAAADALFEKLLREDTMEGFGDDIEDLDFDV